MIVPLKNSKGLTLVEVIVSLAILGIVVAAFGALFVQSAKTNVWAKDRLMAAQLAQQQMESILHQSTILEEKNTTTNEGYDITTEIEAYSKGIENISGILPTDFDAEVTLSGNYSENCDVKVNLSSEGSLVYVKILPNRMIFKANDESGTEITDQTYDDIESPNSVKVKIYCEGSKDLFLDVSNQSGNAAKIYKVYGKNAENNVSINTIDGQVYVYESIYASIEKTDKYKTYKITVTVEKGSKKLAEIISLKTLD